MKKTSLTIRIYAFITILSLAISASKIRVAIAGGGPVGLLAAHAFLSREPNKYEVSLFEAKEDPRVREVEVRSYSLGLNLRGQSAINYFAKNGRSTGLWKAITEEGVPSDSFFVHIGKQKIQIRKPSNDKDPENSLPPTMLIQRNRLCAAMLNELEKEYLSSNCLKTKFNCGIQDVDLSNKKLILTDGKEETYDLLIGADGVRSVVRKAMVTQLKSSFVAEEVVLPGRFKVMVQPFPSSLESDAVHAMEPMAVPQGEGKPKKPDFSLFLIPTTNNKTCALVSWRGEGEDSTNPVDDKVPKVLQTSYPREDTKKLISDAFPLFGEPTDTALDQLSFQKPSEVRTVRCNRYHCSDGMAVLLGDAAHCTGGTLGQGANSGLLDVVALDQCLDEQSQDSLQSNLASVLKSYSRRQVPQGLALWLLLQLPPKGLFGGFYQISQLFWGLISAIPVLKRIIKAKPTQNVLSQSLTPFTDIVEKNRFWINIATKDRKIISYEPE